MAILNCVGGLIAVLYNPFRFGRNGRKISYRHANRYESPPCSTSAKILACSGLFLPFRPVSAGKLVSARILFGPLVFIFFFSVLSQHSAGPKTFLCFDFEISPPLSSLFCRLSPSLCSLRLLRSLCLSLFKLQAFAGLPTVSAASSSSVQSSPAQLQAVAHRFCRLQQSSPAQLQALPTVSAASKVQPPPTGMIFDFFFFFCVCVCVNL